MDGERPEEENVETGPPTGRVRIVGAERAGRLAGEEHVEHEEHEEPTSLEHTGDVTAQRLTTEGHVELPADSGVAEVGDAGVGAADSDLPHWTEAPTGEVPAVLLRTSAEDGEEKDVWSSLPGPTWREHDADWEAHEEEFDPSILAHEESRLGSLDDSGSSDRQPWSFELPGTGDDEAQGDELAGATWDATGAGDQDTIMMPAVGGTTAPPPPSEILFSFEEGRSTEVFASTEAFSSSAGAAVETGEEQEVAAELTEQPDPSAVTDAAGKARPSEPDGTDVRTAPEGEESPASTTPAKRRQPSAEARRARVAPRPDGRSGPRRVPAADGAGQARAAEEGGSGRNVPLATASGLAVGIVTLVCFKIGNVASLVVVTVIVTFAAAEAFGAFRRAGHRPATLLGLVATIGLLVGTYNRGEQALPLVLVLLVVSLFLWHLLGVDRRADPLQSTSSTLLVFCWIAVLGSFAALLLDPTAFPDRHGIAFLLGAIIAGVAYDVGALATGVWIGRRPMAPSISPRKTWEGVIGGAVLAILAAVLIVHLLHPWTYGSAAALGIVVAIVTPIGDLSESLVKRFLGLKDMGRILPGHGGLLDRVDGLLFVIPATFFLVRALHLG
ncbi:MAG: phosphatidate cytidylyltransferase [Actinomycetota bacterium]|jgi:phosphatidate cytidylyltransferase|nr:phosphatidate cytidylyltransferase [Actinomycetota bacterium]